MSEFELLLFLLLVIVVLLIIIAGSLHEQRKTNRKLVQAVNRLIQLTKNNSEAAAKIDKRI